MKVLAVDPEDGAAPVELDALLTSAPGVGVLLFGVVQEQVAETLAAKVARSDVEMMAAWGIQSKEFHDLVDRACLKIDRRCVTTWESGPLESFLWNFRHPYLGLISFERQAEEKLLIVLSTDTAVISEVESTSARV